MLISFNLIEFSDRNLETSYNEIGNLSESNPMYFTTTFTRSHAIEFNGVEGSINGFTRSYIPERASVLNFKDAATSSVIFYLEGGSGNFKSFVTS